MGEKKARKQSKEEGGGISVYRESAGRYPGLGERERQDSKQDKKARLCSLLQRIWFYLSDREDYEKINFEIPLLWEANSQHFLLQNGLKCCWSVGTSSTSSIFLPPLMAQSTLSCKPFSLNKTFPHSPLLLWFTCSTDDVLWVLVIRS